jgi:tetratricopeptide (TPR) repeat protein
MNALGQKYLEHDMPELSEGWFLRTLKLKEEHEASYLSLIDAYTMMGKRTAAKSTYKKYFRLFPNNWHAHREFVHLLIDLKDFRSASKELFMLLAKAPRNRGLKKSLARCYMETEKYNEAAILFKDLLRDNPDSISLLRSLILCLDRMGSASSAIELLEKARVYHRDKSAVLMPLGVLYSRMSDYEKAKTIFRNLITTHPNDWRGYHNLATLYMRTGQKTFAAKFFETAERLREKRTI